MTLNEIIVAYMNGNLTDSQFIEALKREGHFEGMLARALLLADVQYDDKGNPVWISRQRLERRAN